MYHLDCTFCHETVESRDVNAVKSQAKTHLTANHADDVMAVLSNRHEDVPCYNNCGYVVPIGGADVTGVECPHCGHDNFSPLVKQYVYWRITEQ